ncbi:MAG: heme exporter protein CcmB [Phycisphaerales bacterium]
MRALADTLLLVRKDLLIEARARQGVVLATALGVLTVGLLAGGLGGGGGAPGARVGAVVWAAYLFGGVLIFERTMAAERADDAVSAVLLSPVARGAVYAGKLLTNLVLLLALAAVVTPVGLVLMSAGVAGVGAAAELAWAVVLGLVGLAAAGTLLSGALSAGRLGGGALALLVLPLCAPLVLASTVQVMSVMGAGPAGGPPAGAVVVALDVLFIVTGWLLYGVVLEA